jgi:hypothetical protein
VYTAVWGSNHDSNDNGNDGSGQRELSSIPASQCEE